MSQAFFEGLREALARRTPGPTDELPAVFREALRPAAVLIPLFEVEGQIQVLFTERSKDLKNHAGQVSFPGGSVAKEDRDRQATALREAREEVGLRPEDCEILGLLDPSPVVTLFEITPVVARIPAGYPFVPAPGEVARLIVLPLKLFLDPAALEVSERQAFGMKHRVLYYRVGGEQVWGATARILEQLLLVAAPLL